ncbi:MAG: NAD(P)-dependent oxidoreductase [Proteobacteria bacterium]|nr:NAD(P)-dependent oxidoreductase [Pseudomonadota bacterium]
MALSKDNAVVGFIGTGIMGRSMAGHIQAAGYPLHVYNRTRAKAEPLIAKGAIWHDTVAGVAQACNVIITIVGYPKDVEGVYLGKGGVLEAVKRGSYIVDMTTSSPSLAQKIYEAARKKGVSSLDAPVSGGDVGARDAKLSIMVGGDKEAFEAVKPIFQLMGTNIVLQGGAGAGQHTKMVNQIVIASTIMGVAEGLTYANRVGLDIPTVLDCIGTGAAGGFQLNVLGRKMAGRDFAPGFFVKHFIKDMDIALEEAKRASFRLPGLKLSRDQFADFAKAGGGGDGTQGIYKFYEKM